MTGPLIPYRSSFEAALRARGYTDLSAAAQMRLMADLSRWLTRHRVAPGEFNASKQAAFVADRRRRGCVEWRSLHGLVPVLDHLRSQHVVPAADLVVASTPLDRLVESYRTYLIEERGLVPTTVSSYAAVARRFLDKQSAGTGVELDRLVSADVTHFVIRECDARRDRSGLVTALRSLLRFLFFEGLITTELAWAVPTVASWSDASLPKAVAPDDVAALLRSCDRRGAMGRRDYAMVTLMARLGLRPGEVARLALDDIDWRAGDVIVRGKGRRDERLPLPGDVGDAVVAYLRRRPRCQCRAVFITVRAPWRELSPSAVTNVVYRACGRAGLAPVGAHRLRHSAATQMLQRGSTLAEVAQVLRHHDPLTTSVYAKVDRRALRSLAQPWPEVTR